MGVGVIAMKATIITLAIVLAHGAASSTAMAQTQAPLPQGKPAGVRQAQQISSQTMWIVGAIGLMGIGIGLAVSNDGNSPSQTTMSTTSTVNPP